jgi:hypothetical protein
LVRNERYRCREHDRQKHSVHPTHEHRPP